ncbi:hypothetical protein A7985_07715 [Pseudoalteromonas luteoviolacea]|uniref:Uncharacterized protein n=1 Tax=Pseudoalteromonas luteoviolacea TaxID=43657 RepID=A0A1C0TWW2_9GAMM|nr:hypothetical protein A7985_07715 [Pseudoalteromonas luteoviolacea]
MSENKLRAIFSFTPLVFIVVGFFRPSFEHEFSELLYMLSFVASLVIGVVCPIPLILKSQLKRYKVMYSILALFNIHLLSILLLNHLDGIC